MRISQNTFNPKNMTECELILFYFRKKSDLLLREVEKLGSTFPCPSIRSRRTKKQPLTGAFKTQSLMWRRSKGKEGMNVEEEGGITRDEERNSFMWL